MAIGIFDSGVGGLTVVREVKRQFPSQTIFYLGDTARVPYGTKSPKTIERYALKCQDFLCTKSVELIMVACNTASANALPALIENSQVPVIGAVRPGALAATRASVNQCIAVLGTLGTVRSKAYEKAILSLEKNATVVSKACPLFVPLAEEGWGDTDIARDVALRYLIPLFKENPSIDTVVLACTHYPLLRNVIAEVCEKLSSKSIQIVDSAASMTEEISRYISTNHSSNIRGKLHCYVTDETLLKTLAPRFLGEELESLELVDL